jgi:DnaK suppressor protein
VVSHQTIGERDTVLTAEDLAALRENLNEQRLFRQEQLRQFAADSTTRADDRRGRADAAHIEVGVKLAASARMVLADVEAALARMNAGRYGICHLCRRPVERHRLLIVPQARDCGRCPQVREAGR